VLTISILNYYQFKFTIKLNDLGNRYSIRGGSNKKRKVIRKAEWTSFTIETEFTASAGDSIEVMLVGSLYIIPQGFNYFDLIKLVNLD